MPTIEESSFLIYFFHMCGLKGDKATESSKRTTKFSSSTLTSFFSSLFFFLFIHGGNQSQKPPAHLPYIHWAPVSSVGKVAGKYLALHPLWWVDSAINKEETYGWSTKKVYTSGHEAEKVKCLPVLQELSCEYRFPGKLISDLRPQRQMLNLFQSQKVYALIFPVWHFPW